MRLRMSVGILALPYDTGNRIAVEVSLRRTRDAVGIMETRIKPLGTVWRRHLVDKHVFELIFERLRVLHGIEIAMLLSPVPPAASKATNHLLCAALGTREDLPLLVFKGIPLLVFLRDSSLAEVFTHHNIRRNLGPICRNFRTIHLEHDGTIRIHDFARAPLVANLIQGIAPRSRKYPLDAESSARLYLLLRTTVHIIYSGNVHWNIFRCGGGDGVHGKESENGTENGDIF